MKILLRGLKLFVFLISLYFWFFYAYQTLDRSPEAQQVSGGGYLPDKYSFLILTAIVFVFNFRNILTRKLSLGGVLAKIIFIVLLLLGVMAYFAALK